MNNGRDLLAKKIEALGLTQSEAAEKAGVSQSLLSRILGGRSQPSIETAFKFQRKLGIPAQSWCTGERSRRGGPRRPRVASPAGDSSERQVA